MNLDQLLTDAAHHVADQVDPPEVDLDAVRTRAHASRRRTTALAVTAAAVTAALIGIPLLADHDSTAPQPAVPPRSGIIFTLPDADCAVGRCLKPRTYGIPLGQDSGHRLRAKVAVQGAGWGADGGRHRVSRANAEGAVVLSVYQPHQFAGGPQPCDLAGLRTVATDAPMDDVVRLLATLPQFAVVDGPRAIPAFGRDTRYLKVRADSVSCPAVPGNQYNLAEIYGHEGSEPLGDSDIDPGRPVSIEFHVLQLEGKPVVVEARQEGVPDDAMIRGLEQLRESLTFGFRGQ